MDTRRCFFIVYCKWIFIVFTLKLFKIVCYFESVRLEFVKKQNDSMSRGIPNYLPQQETIASRIQVS